MLSFYSGIISISKRGFLTSQWPGNCRRTFFIIIIISCNLDNNCPNSFTTVIFFPFRRKIVWPTIQILLVFCQIYFTPAAVTDFNWMETTALILCVTLLDFVSLNFNLVSLGPAECSLRQPLSLLAILLSRAALFAFCLLSD